VPILTLADGLSRVTAAVTSAVTDPQPEPPREVVLATAALALVFVLSRRLWPLTRTVITIAHEGGHATAALLARRRLRGIRLHSDTSGVTLSHGRPSGPGMVFTAAAGYVAPSLAGVGYAALLWLDRITAALWLGVVLLALMLIAIRNVYGVVAVVGTAAVIVGVAQFTEPRVQAAFAYGFAWFLLLGGVRPVFELQRLRRLRLAPDSDADQLARLTHVPGILWVGWFALVTLGGAAAGTWLLTVA
jgi:hypothetical protein